MARTVSTGHKEAMRRGRVVSSTVDRYLKAIATPKRQGRQVPVEELERRREAAVTSAKSATGVARLKLLQEVKNLDARVKAARGVAPNHNLGQLEKEFVKVAAAYGEAQGISYGTWREYGVPAEVLKRAGVKRTRG